MHPATHPARRRQYASECDRALAERPQNAPLWWA